jgi:hypothetical protein
MEPNYSTIPAAATAIAFAEMIEFLPASARQLVRIARSNIEYTGNLWLSTGI